MGATTQQPNFVLAGVVALLILIFVAPSSAQSTRVVADTTAITNPALPAAAPVSELESKSIRRTLPKSATPTTNTATVRPQQGLDYGRLLLAMGVVLTLIIILRFVGLRLFPASAQSKTTGVIRVLSRSAVAPKQQFLLVQVGGRLIVVADSHSRMTPLTEITDPLEVASIVGQITAESPASISGAFSSLFGKAKHKFDADVVELGKQPVKEDTGKMLYDDEATQFDEAGEPRRERVTDDVTGEPELHAATLELKDLGERVRALAGQIRRQ